MVSLLRCLREPARAATKPLAIRTGIPHLTSAL
jgi:hypothetical protein